MTESNQAPQLSLTPEAPDKELDEVVASIQEKPAAPAAQTAPKLDSSQLTPAERKAIDDPSCSRAVAKGSNSTV